MDATFRTPLLDCFARGEASPDVRQLAASGALAPRVHEQIALLVLLSADPDPAIRETTERTLARLPAGPLAGYLARPDTSQEVRDFFAARGVEAAGAAPRVSDEPLVGEEHAPPGSAEEAAGESGAEATPLRLGTAQRLATMSVAERLKVAMQGSREERGVLIRDANRLVSSAVLSSPKLSESEVEAIARMTNVSDEVLRIIGTSRAWTKNYQVISALTRNPKTPVGVALTLMPRLIERDLKMLSTDRNIPEPIRLSARRIVVHGNERRR
ncbi:MAG: hypothetical protein EHM24_06155 [Acidobacteria bacterium]|nr:MAG: hypothetical protein EHM24_16270 [Acidobacteriota bacterium]RPJ74413.1 MAG: hypothetical protein EHM24_06155 [Acidobacteriota bacterium]